MNASPHHLWPPCDIAPRALAGALPGAIHVWSAGLDVGEDLLARFEASLSADERARAGRFRFPRDRDRSIASRGILRAILGDYVATPAGEIQITATPASKPHLAIRDEPQVHFNVSHSENLALVAITTAGEIGVDVEHLRPVPDYESLAASFFAPEESERLDTVPEAARSRAFFQCWTRKESYIKAVGEGMGIPLDSFAVAFTEGDAPRIVHIGSSADEAARWTVGHLEPAPGFVGAYAVRASGLALRHFQWRAPV